MQPHGIAPIDLVAVEPLPVRGDRRARRAFDDCVENIDIGGPALIRAAAKNHDFVAVADRPRINTTAVLAELAARGGTTLAVAPPPGRRGLCPHRRLRRRHRRLVRRDRREDDVPDAPRPRRHAAPDPALRRKPAPAGRLLRHRRPPRRRHRARRSRARNCPTTTSTTPTPPSNASPSSTPRPSPSSSTPTPAASPRPRRWPTPGTLAFRCDPVSPFGGIVAVNRTLDAAAAEKIAAIFTEVIVAPDADEAAKAVAGAQEEPAPAADRRPARPGGPAA